MNSTNELDYDALRRRVFHNRSVEDDKLAELSSFFVKKQCPRNYVFLHAGEKWNYVLYIHEGVIRLFYGDENGREFNKGFFWEDHLVWPVAPSARRDDSLFSIAALESCVVSVCPFKPFYDWLRLSGWWETFALPYAEAFAEQKFLREYEFLMSSARDRYRSFCKEFPGLAHRIPDYHIASYIGITNVSLSRIKSSAEFNLC